MFLHTKWKALVGTVLVARWLVFFIQVSLGFIVFKGILDIQPRGEVNGLLNLAEFIGQRSNQTSTTHDYSQEVEEQPSSTRSFIEAGKSSTHDPGSSVLDHAGLLIRIQNSGCQGRDLEICYCMISSSIPLESGLPMEVFYGRAVNAVAQSARSK